MRESTVPDRATLRDVARIAGVHPGTVSRALNPATEALYIANPLSRHGLAALFSTHPPMEERIRRLRELDASQGIHY